MHIKFYISTAGAISWLLTFTVFIIAESFLNIFFIMLHHVLDQINVDHRLKYSCYYFDMPKSGTNGTFCDRPIQ